MENLTRVTGVKGLTGDSITKQALKWTPQGQRKRIAEEHLERDLEREMWTAGFKFSWRKQT